MDTTELSDLLAEALMAGDDDLTVRTFAEAMLLTSNDGLVVRLANGDEFQVTVTQSKFAES